jgi:hypothetical protein
LVERSSAKPNGFRSKGWDEEEDEDEAEEEEGTGISLLSLPFVRSNCHPIILVSPGKGINYACNMILIQH